jgi:hypothetical protein
MTQSIFQYGDRNPGPCLRNIHERFTLKFVSKFSSPLRRVKSSGTCGETLVSRTVFLGKTRHRKKKNWYFQRDTCVGFHFNSIYFTPQEKLWGRD